MKKKDIKKLKELIVTPKEVIIPSGWELIKDPTKMSDNTGNECFKVVIARNGK